MIRHDKNCRNKGAAYWLSRRQSVYLWHYVLNYWYLPQSVADGDAFAAELAAAGLDVYRTKPLPEFYHARIVASWQRIFDLDWSVPAIASPKAEKQIQGVVWEITLVQVRKVQAFVAPSHNNAPTATSTACTSAPLRINAHIRSSSGRR